jgi:hypothetical protein
MIRSTMDEDSVMTERDFVEVSRVDLEEAIDALGGFMGDASRYREVQALRERLRTRLEAVVTSEPIVAVFTADSGTIYRFTTTGPQDVLVEKVTPEQEQ